MRACDATFADFSIEDMPVCFIVCLGARRTSPQWLFTSTSLCVMKRGGVSRLLPCLILRHAVKPAPARACRTKSYEPVQQRGGAAGMSLRRMFMCYLRRRCRQMRMSQPRCIARAAMRLCAQSECTQRFMYGIMRDMREPPQDAAPQVMSDAQEAAPSMCRRTLRARRCRVKMRMPRGAAFSPRDTRQPQVCTPPQRRAYVRVS